MKKYIAFLLSIVLLLALCACGGNKDDPPTMDSTPSVQEPSTDDSTTEPSEKPTEPSEPALPQNVALPSTEAPFEYAYHRLYNEYWYRYVGENHVIDFDRYGVLLTIPEEWWGKVDVFCRVEPPEEDEMQENTVPLLEIYITSRAVLESYAKFYNVPGEITRGVEDYVFRLTAGRTSRYLGFEPQEREQDHLTRVGANNHYVFYGRTAAMQEKAGGDYLNIRWAMADTLGQEAVDEALGAVVCSEEQMQELVQCYDLKNEAVDQAEGFAKVLQRYMWELPSGGSDEKFGCGRLVDVDGDERQELLIYYMKPDHSAQMVCEIWGMEENVTEARMIYQGDWGYLAGGPRSLGKLYLVRAEGETYLLNYHNVGEDDNAMHEYWDYYRLVDSGYEREQSCYAYHVVDRKTLEETWAYKIEGEEVTKEEFFSDPIQNAKDATLILCCNVIDEERGIEDGIPWTELLKQLSQT